MTVITNLPEIEKWTERATLIHVATAIHAACIMSTSAPADITDSVKEALDLIAACDEALLPDEKDAT